MYTRLSKTLLVCSVALFASLAALNNITDYGSNYAFVEHVLKMDTTFSQNQLKWRAIDASWIHHALYWFIIFMELAVAAFCWLGGFLLFKSVRDVTQFNQAKRFAIIGLTLGVLLWFTGFMTVGGEWFLMWQSRSWNGQQAAFRIVAIMAIILIYVAQVDNQTEVPTS